MLRDERNGPTAAALQRQNATLLPGVACVLTLVLLLVLVSG